LDVLARVAAKEDRKDAIEFVEVLKNHAMNEEEVLYPAALVLGELLQKA
jgi:hemerythrin superfamily protein